MAYYTKLLEMTPPLYHSTFIYNVGSIGHDWVGQVKLS